ncbi:MAG: four helix bundle protein [Saprospiraceae bacterium]|nr:four helix bundle protein [Bacteroidia bacterium]MBT8229142.1 four helix bundle protein [Bacteroidia bacterium]NNF22148.1 four helix bundle protein [Saprospiraceae bacterium]NNK90390.1 four helix bundle protein [Saprospiraceae bacterium]
MKNNIIKQKSFTFAVSIIRANKFLLQQKQFIIANQLFRSGTSIGAMVREAEMAESKKDFIHKMSVALKEANETDYWIKLILVDIKDECILNLQEKCLELIKILVSIIKTSKRSIYS